MNLLHAWMAFYTAGLALGFYCLHCLKKRVDGKQDRRQLGRPRLRAHRVDTVFHDRDDQGREHWLCVNCGASVPQMGHTIAACEECQARAEVIKAGMEAATSGMETPGIPPNK